jgi:hypothetical protein
LFLDTDVYEIDRWDEHEIQTKPLEFGCVRIIRRVVRLSKSVTGIRSTIRSEGFCSSVDKDELFLKLVDGKEIQKIYADKRKTILLKLLQASPEVMDMHRK